MRRRWTFNLSLTIGPEPDEQPQQCDDKTAHTQAEQAPDYHPPEMHIGFRGQ